MSYAMKYHNEGWSYVLYFAFHSLLSPFLHFYPIAYSPRPQQPSDNQKTFNLNMALSPGIIAAAATVAVFFVVLMTMVITCCYCLLRHQRQMQVPPTHSYPPNAASAGMPRSEFGFSGGGMWSSTNKYKVGFLTNGADFIMLYQVGLTRLMKGA